MHNRNHSFMLAALAICAIGFTSFAQADNLTAPRQTSFRQSAGMSYAQNTNIIYRGGMVMLVNGLLQPASASVAGTVLGEALATSDNTGVRYLATRVVPVDRQIFLCDNDGSISNSRVGLKCYVLDDHTVSIATGGYTSISGGVTNVVAAFTATNVVGRILCLDPTDSTSVWVDMRQFTGSTP